MGAIDESKEVPVPAPPKALADILQLARGPGLDKDGLAQAAVGLPGLDRQLHRLAGMSTLDLGPVNFLGDAIGLVGSRAVVVAALISSLLRELAMLATNDALAACWQRVLTNAGVCRWTGSSFGLDPQEAFLLGLVQECGVLLLGAAKGPEYVSLIEQYPRQSASPLAEAERRAVGADHAQRGAKLLQQWNFPAAWVDAVACHHQMDPAGTTVGRRVSLSGIMAAVEVFTDFLLAPTEERFERMTQVTSVVGAFVDEVDRLPALLDRQRGEIARLFDFDLAGLKSCEEVYRQNRQLVDSARSRSSGDAGEAAPLLFDLQTGVLHRNALRQRLGQEISLAKRNRWPLAVVLVRVDRATRLLSAGQTDQATPVLREVALVIQQSIRASDSLFRFNNDSFCLLAADADGVGVRVLIDRVRALLARLAPNPEALFAAVTVTPAMRPVDGEALLQTASANLATGAGQGAVYITEQ